MSNALVKCLRHMTFVCVYLYVSAAQPAFAQMYKCQTSGGQTFSDKPCGKDAKVVQFATQEPSAESRQEAIDRAERDKGEVAKADKAREIEAKAAAEAAAKKPVVTQSQLASQCVDKYRPHLAYPQGVRILGQSVQIDGFGHTLYVTVRTLTNPNTPVRIDPGVLSERFVCRLDPATGFQSIDDRYTADYVEKHKRGGRL